MHFHSTSSSQRNIACSTLTWTLTLTLALTVMLYLNLTQTIKRQHVCGTSVPHQPSSTAMHFQSPYSSQGNHDSSTITITITLIVTLTLIWVLTLTLILYSNLTRAIKSQHVWGFRVPIQRSSTAMHFQRFCKSQGNHAFSNLTLTLMLTLTLIGFLTLTPMLYWNLTRAIMLKHFYPLSQPLFISGKHWLLNPNMNPNPYSNPNRNVVLVLDL